MEHDEKEIVVTGESRLLDIQKAFAGFYPFLMIEFFHSAQSGATQAGSKLAVNERLKSLAGIDKVLTIDVSNKRMVSEVVRDLASLLRVKAQVCRKSGNVWNAISLTDGWSLERQNLAGEYISGIMAVHAEN